MLGGGIESGLGGSNLYDFDEGIRKYVRRVFNPILEVVHQTSPEAEPADKQLEEYKAYHQKEIKSWKNEKFQSRIRGGASLHNNLGGVNGTLQ